MVRFRALRGLGALAGSAMVDLALVDESGPIALPAFSELIAWACRSSSPVDVSPMALEADAIFSKGLDVCLGRCCRSTDKKILEVHPGCN